MVLRALLIPLVITWFVPFAVWPYMNEVILLERNPLRRRRRGQMTTFRRSMALHGGSIGDLFARWLGSVAFGGLLFASFWLTMQGLAGVLLSEWKFEGLTYTLYFPLALWMVVGYFTVARFLGYLDLRIRNEGWEVELMMRAEGGQNVEATDMSDPVTSGRNALDHWFGYPWYDAKTDAVRRVDVPKPWHGWEWSPSLGSLLQVLGWTLVVVLVAAVVYFVVRALWQREGRKAGENEAEPAGGADRVESLPLPVGARRLDLLAEAERAASKGTTAARSSFYSATNCCNSTSTGGSTWPAERPIINTCGRSAPGRRWAGWSSRRRSCSRTSSSAITHWNVPRSRRAGRGWRSLNGWWIVGSGEWRVESGEWRVESGDV